MIGTTLELYIPFEKNPVQTYERENHLDILATKCAREF